jgi:hypothetical protein
LDSILGIAFMNGGMSPGWRIMRGIMIGIIFIIMPGFMEAPNEPIISTMTPMISVPSSG